jgi:hypothetical protein
MSGAPGKLCGNAPRCGDVVSSVDGDPSHAGDGDRAWRCGGRQVRARGATASAFYRRLGDAGRRA